MVCFYFLIFHTFIIWWSADLLLIDHSQIKLLILLILTCSGTNSVVTSEHCISDSVYPLFDNEHKKFKANLVSPAKLGDGTANYILVTAVNDFLSDYSGPSFSGHSTEVSLPRVAKLFCRCYHECIYFSLSPKAPL